jgi:hypothetical protein
MPLAVLLCPGTNICGDFEPVAETIRDQPRDQEALFVRSPFGVEYWGCQGFLRISAARPVRADERSGILGTHLHHIVMPWLVCLALFALCKARSANVELSTFIVGAFQADCVGNVGMAYCCKLSNDDGSFTLVVDVQKSHVTLIPDSTIPLCCSGASAAGLFRRCVTVSVPAPRPYPMHQVYDLRVLSSSRMWSRICGLRASK